MTRPSGRTHRGPPRLLTLALLLLTLLAQPAAAFDYQFHGFASQGFVISNGNNLFGDSTHGSINFYEVGINSTVDLGHGLLISAQGLLRDAGAGDTGSPRLDYALADYQFLSTSRFNLGVRGGRVKNPFGLFNETRDVVFTRPGILMPQSVYFDSQGLRSLLFSSDGVQLYGGLNLGDHYVSLVGGYNPPSDLSDEEVRQLTSGMLLPGKIALSDFYTGRLQDEVDGGIWRFAFSYIHGRLQLDPNPGVPVSAKVDADLYLLSARYNAEHFSLTAEYLINHGDTSGNLVAPGSNTGNGYYLQADYRIDPQWSVMARYDVSIADQGDPSGRNFAATTGGSRYSRFANDLTIGGSWHYGSHWGLWAEYHNIQGSYTVPMLDNQGRTPAAHWNVFMLMAAFRF